MPETQSKGHGEGAVEKNTSRPNEQGGTGGSSAVKWDDATVRGVQDKTRSDAKKILGS